MSGQGDKLKGHAKEVAGDLTGDESLEHEGKADRKGGEIKEKLTGAVDKVKDAVTRD